VVIACLLAVLAPATGGAQPAAPTPEGSPSAAAAKHPVRGEEIAELRTRTSRTYRRADGKLLARIHAGSVNFRDGQGDWRPIDNELVQSGSSLRNAANRYSLTLPGRLDAAVRYEEDGRWVSFALKDALPVAAEAKGSKAVYREALPPTSVSTQRRRTEPRRI